LLKCNTSLNQLNIIFPHLSLHNLLLSPFESSDQKIESREPGKLRMRQLVLSIGICSTLLLVTPTNAFGHRSRRDNCCRVAFCNQLRCNCHSSGRKPVVHDNRSIKSDCHWSFEVAEVGDGVRITGTISCGSLTCSIDEQLTNSKEKEVRCIQESESGTSRLRVEIRLTHTKGNCVRVQARRCVDVLFISDLCDIWEELGTYCP
jgi:hypothetical protein